MSHHKIWFKHVHPTKIISTGKSVGDIDETYFYSDVLPDDDDFYLIDQGPPQVVNRKSQPVIDSIVLAREHEALSYQQKILDANALLRQNFLTDLTTSDINDYVDNNVNAPPKETQLFKDLLIIISSLLKINDYSK